MISSPLVALLQAAPDTATKTASAQLHVQGLGWWTNRELRQTLLRLLDGERRATLDANAIEDAAMIVFSDLTEVGYAEPRIEVEARLPDGTSATYTLDPRLDQPLPRPLTAAQVVLHVKPGRRFSVASVKFDGLTALSEDDARVYFRGENTLFVIGAERAYSPARVQRAVSNLLEELRRRGYAEAEVEADDVQIDHATGAVRIHVTVVEGAKWTVTALEYSPAPEGGAPTGLELGRLDRPWSSLWRQDMETAIRRWYYQRGYPDVTANLEARASEPANGIRHVTVTAAVVPGTKVTLGQVRFEGNERTHESVLRPLAPAKPGVPLNPSEMEEGQFRISHLGVFNTVDLRYDPPGGDTRDAVYHLVEGNRSDASLLFGYGSYEQLRGGIEQRSYNLFGLAHHSTLELVESMKSTRGEYDYTVPELFGSSIDGTAKVFGLRRQERSFLHEEYGTNFSIALPVKRLGLDFTTGYTFKRLRDTNNSLATGPTDPVQTDAAIVDFGVARDRRDNPLTPRRGYRIFAQVEEASREFGGNVDYQRLHFGAAYHTPWGSSRWFHLGLVHEVLTTLGARNDDLLPANVRFYPGGDNSIRGYREGEAAPRTPDGQFIGAKTTMLLSLELEQALTSKWSAVVFSDSLGMATRMAHYPFDERLYSVGLGVRFKTIVGPLRLEYGHNLHRRPLDPSGTLLFSIGFPF
ncbi:MAG TPA: BamA/TamA family outer membrane protein [Opitutaceae bacterium]|nr:BamA/TamA family outer membrane protein [Opitutaceae bacterium]